MKALINGINVEGTPQELAEFQRLMEASANRKQPFKDPFPWMNSKDPFPWVNKPFGAPPSSPIYYGKLKFNE